MLLELPEIYRHWCHIESDIPDSVISWWTSIDETTVMAYYFPGGLLGKLSVLHSYRKKLGPGTLSGGLRADCIHVILLNTHPSFHLLDPFIKHSKYRPWF